MTLFTDQAIELDDSPCSSRYGTENLSTAILSLYPTHSLKLFVSGCVGALTDPMGVIESPNFPNNYPPNQQCSWVINGILGGRINASFSHMEVYGYGSSCRGDYVEVQYRG